MSLKTVLLYEPPGLNIVDKHAEKVTQHFSLTPLSDRNLRRADRQTDRWLPLNVNFPTRVSLLQSALLTPLLFQHFKTSELLLCASQYIAKGFVFLLLL